jgi:hypothetical protein
MNEPTSPRLHCLGGEPAPAEVVRDWSRLLALPERARQGLWEILAPSLSGGVDATMERRAESFCHLFELPAPDLQASLRVCRFLFTRAGALDLGVHPFSEDLAALSGGDPPAGAIVLSWYEAAKSLVRRGILEKSVLDHGRVLVGLDWRVDRIAGSDRGVHFDAPVALMTLRLREGGGEERTTIYVLPEVLGQIKEAVSRIERLVAASGAAGGQAPGQTPLLESGS